MEASPRLQFLLKIAILADLLGSQSKTTVLIQTNNFLASLLGIQLTIPVLVETSHFLADLLGSQSKTTVLIEKRHFEASLLIEKTFFWRVCLDAS